MKKNHFLWDCVVVIFGTGLLALGTYMFIAPNQIAPGGVSGIAILLNHLFHIPIGWLNLLINIPLLLLGHFSLGKRFLAKSVISVIAFTVFYDYIFSWCHLPQFTGDSMLAALFGGALSGAGIAFAFMVDGSTGGIDVTSKVVQMKLPHVPIGKIVFLTDVIIIAASTVVFKSISSALYATVAMFVTAQVIDAMMYGLDSGKMLMIISDHSDEIAAEIMKEADRGVTKLLGTGAYQNQDKVVLMCAVRKNEYYHLKRIVQEIDPAAFIIVTTTSEVVGEGFKAIDKV